MAHLVTCLHCSLQISHRIEHDLASQQVTDTTGGLHLGLLPFLQDQCDFLGPYVHYLVDDVDEVDLAFRCLNLLVDFGNDGADAILTQLFFKHLLKDTQNDLELLVCSFGHLHVYSIRDAVGSLSD